MCIVTDICDTADIFFTFPPAGPQTKGLVKSLDFPTQFQFVTPKALVSSLGPAWGRASVRWGPLGAPPRRVLCDRVLFSLMLAVGVSLCVTCQNHTYECEGVVAVIARV